ncbi:hypothetical protein JST97_24680 [bacterium]|nr:hypothetical protein [bacterium]
MSALVVKRRLVTACNEVYFRCLLQLLLSLERTLQMRELDVIVFDLGLSPANRQQLTSRFPWIQLRDCDLTTGPEHLRQLSSFAWKPTLIARLAEENAAPLLWLDSACVVTGSLEPVWAHLRQNGVWSPFGGGSRMDFRTHRGMLDYLNANELERGARFRSACTCAFDPSHPGALDLVRKWRELAWNREALLPAGCCNANHRYDQSLLTVLLVRSGLDPSSEELDVSGLFPTPYLRTRNKVSNRVPLWLDPLCRLWFWTYREIDVRWLRFRAGMASPQSLPLPRELPA